MERAGLQGSPGLIFVKRHRAFAAAFSRFSPIEPMRRSRALRITRMSGDFAQVFSVSSLAPAGEGGKTRSLPRCNALGAAVILAPR